MKINELEDGFKGSITVLLSNVTKGITNKGAPYLSMMLQDKSGEMDAKFWNVNEEIIDNYLPGMVIEAQGDVICHQKQLQFRMRNAEIMNLQNIDINDYAPEGPIPKEELKKRIGKYIDSIQNPSIVKIVKAILQDHEKDFFEYPAATKNHHDFVGGLATHVLGMLDLAQQVAKQYPLLNRDLLIGGIILHDIGKLQELSGVLISEYTTQGKLLGHISIMQAELYKKAEELGLAGEEITLLRHMILSHHGVYAYGSPVLPMLPEAEMLYLLDNMDARMNTMEKALKQVSPGEFTQRIFALENRIFYKSKQ